MSLILKPNFNVQQAQALVEGQFNYYWDNFAATAPQAATAVLEAATDDQLQMLADVLQDPAPVRTAALQSAVLFLIQQYGQRYVVEQITLRPVHAVTAAYLYHQRVLDDSGLAAEEPLYKVYAYLAALAAAAIPIAEQSLDRFAQLIEETGLSEQDQAVLRMIRKVSLSEPASQPVAAALNIWALTRDKKVADGIQTMLGFAGQMAAVINDATSTENASIIDDLGTRVEPTYEAGFNADDKAELDAAAPDRTTLTIQLDPNDPKPDETIRYLVEEFSRERDLPLDAGINVEIQGFRHLSVVAQSAVETLFNAACEGMIADAPWKRHQFNVLDCPTGTLIGNVDGIELRMATEGEVSLGHVSPFPEATAEILETVNGPVCEFFNDWTALVEQDDSGLEREFDEDDIPGTGDDGDAEDTGGDTDAEREEFARFVAAHPESDTDVPVSSQG